MAAILLASLLPVVMAVPNNVYFNSGPAYETSLTADDFQRARYVTKSETPTNAYEAESKGKKFEGDIAGVDEASILPVMGDQGIMYNAIRSTYALWPSKTVPYSISSQYSSYSRARIAAAMDEYGKQTCIKFVPSDGKSDYVYITPDDGCYSMVGKQSGRQLLSLGEGCVTKGVIMHELMHAVGFFHEQSRSDRDEHVTIQYQNIQSGMESQFRKYSLRETQNLDTAYDYGSIMHYGPTAFSKNGQATIVPSRSGARIGQRDGFSQVDVTKINRLYSCDGGIVQPGPVTPRPTIAPVINSCEDRRNDCPSFVSSGFCTSFASWMNEWCPRSCGKCTGGGSRPIPSSSCTDVSSFCVTWAGSGFCSNAFFTDYMNRNCRASCNRC